MPSSRGFSLPWKTLRSRLRPLDATTARFPTQNSSLRWGPFAQPFHIRSPRRWDRRFFPWRHPILDGRPHRPCWRTSHRSEWASKLLSLSPGLHSFAHSQPIRAIPRRSSRSLPQQQSSAHRKISDPLPRDFPCCSKQWHFRASSLAQYSRAAFRRPSGVGNPQLPASILPFPRAVRRFPHPIPAEQKCRQHSSWSRSFAHCPSPAMSLTLPR